MAHSRCVPSQPRGDKSGECGVTGGVLSHRRSAESQAKLGVDPTDVHLYLCPQMYIHIYVGVGIALELGTWYVYALYGYASNAYAWYVYASYGYRLGA